MNGQDIISIIRTNREALRALGVAHAYLFGSAARNEIGPHSDIDVMIDVASEPFSMLDLIGVQQALEDLLHSSVDVVVREDALQGKNLRDAASQAVNVF